MAAPAPQDWISHLPVEIQASILSHLPINEAVRTSLLSRHWRHVWTTIPRLHINFPVNRYPPDFIRIVYHILLFHRGPIHSFHLSHLLHPNFSGDIQLFLLALYRKGGLEDLRIENIGHEPFNLSLPNFRSLNYLELNSCHLTLPSGFNGFDSLKTLNLSDVEISKGDIESLISKCKNLLFFSGYIRTDGRMSIEISSASLYDLHIVIGGTVRGVRVRFAPRLECARISVCCPEWRRFAADYVKILGDLREVTSLSVCGTMLACLSLLLAPASLMLPFHKLVVLELRIDALSKEIFDGIACLLRLTPHLELLEIEGQCGQWDLRDAPPEDYWEKQEPFHCLTHSLKRVYTNYINLDDARIMQIIKFILQNGKVLQLMDIGYSDNSGVEPWLLEELSKMQLASSNSKMMFYNPDGPHVSENVPNVKKSGSAPSEENGATEGDQKVQDHP